MADYHSILNKAVSGLAHNSHGTRSAIYDKARQAIDRQLRAMQPAPTEAAITKQLQLLEAAIERIEGEQSAAAVDGAAGSAAPETAAMSEPAPEEESPASEPDPQPTMTAAPPAPSADAPEATQPPPHIDPPAQSAPAVSEPAADPAPPITPPVDLPQAAPPPDAAVDPVLTDPRGMDYSEAMLEPQTTAKPRSGGGMLATLLPIALGLALVGGGAYALWLNRDALLDGLLGADEPVAASQESTATSTQPPAQTQSDDQPTDTEPAPADNEAEGEPPATEDVRTDEPPEPIIKSNSRLSSDGQTIEAEPLPDEDVDTPGTTVDETQAQNPPEDDAAASPVTEVDGGQTTGTDATQALADTAPSVAQKAFLYEEGSSGSNPSRDNAAIIWSLAREEVAGGNEAVIRGQLDIPGRGMTMSLAIKRNEDESLPASHIIELMFQVPPDFAGGSVANIARVMMKSSEQSRGESLIAVPAKIDDGFFLIALNNLDQAVATNRSLILDSAWIDIPLGYATGQWALVTLEKGAVGDKVFRDAFADWDNR